MTIEGRKEGKATGDRREGVSLDRRLRVSRLTRIFQPDRGRSGRLTTSSPLMKTPFDRATQYQKTLNFDLEGRPHSPHSAGVSSSMSPGSCRRDRNDPCNGKEERPPVLGLPALLEQSVHVQARQGKKCRHFALVELMFARRWVR